MSNKINFDFDTFSKSSYEEWKSVAFASLKGADFDKIQDKNVSIDGIKYPIIKFENKNSNRMVARSRNGRIAHSYEVENLEFIAKFSSVDFPKLACDTVAELTFLINRFVSFLDSNSVLNSSDSIFYFQTWVNSNFYIQISKLRALRLLLLSILEQYDLNNCEIHLQAVSNELDKTIFDTYSNVVRMTGETLATGIGGADSIQLQTHNALIKEPEEFEWNILFNIVNIVNEESYVPQVRDAVSGAWFFEDLTEQIIEAVWSKLAKSNDNIDFEAEILAQANTTFNSLQSKINSAQSTLIGVNKYSNELENNELIKTYNSDLDVKIGERLSSNFENLLKVNKKISKALGRNPKIYVLLISALEKVKPRLDFCIDYLKTGFFDIEISSAEFEAMEDAAMVVDLKYSDIDAVLICGLDADYKQNLSALLGTLKSYQFDKPLLLAGMPLEDYERYQKLGIDSFLRIGQDRVDLLNQLLDKIMQRTKDE